MENRNMKFMREVVKLPMEQFLGVVRILKVSLIDPDDPKKMKDFSVVFEELMKAYDAAPRKRRRELYSIVAAAARKENSNGTDSTNSETDDPDRN